MTQLDYELKCGLLYARTSEYQSRLRSATQSVAAMLKICRRPYLALSFGKQSIVVAHMIYEQQPNVPMLFMSSWESFLLHDYQRVIESFTSRFPINLSIIQKDNVSWNEHTWKETRDLGQKDLQTFADEVLEWDGLFMGLSKDESFARRVSLSKSNTPWKTIYQYTSGRYRCTPIQHWHNRDLAAYLAIHDLPLLSAYNEGLEVRTTARITRNCAEMNGLIDLKARDIAAYNQICNRFPELRSK